MPVGDSARTDVFISYARQDRERAEALVRVFEQQGWSVWWDRDLTPGNSYRKEIGGRLAAARCVLVLWSRRSVDSGWVTDEASAGLARNALVPALLDDVPQPLGFQQIQAVRLTDWDGTTSHPEAAHLLRTIGDILGRSPVPEPAPNGRVTWRRWITLPALAVPLLTAVALRVAPLPGMEISADIRATRVGFTLRSEQALFTTPVAVESLSISGLREFRLTPTRRYDEPMMLLAAHQGTRRGTIALDVPILPAGTRVTLDSAGSFAGFGTSYRLSLEGSVPELGVSLNGPVQLIVPSSDPVSTTHEAHHDRLVAHPESGVIDLDLFLVAGSVPSFATMDSVEALDFTRSYKIREGEGRDDPIVSTIVLGSISFPSLGRDTQTLAAGEALAFSHSSGKLRVVGLPGNQIAVTFKGSVVGFRGGTLDRPSYFDFLARRHPVSLGAVAALYAIAAGAVALRWKKKVR